MPGFEKQFTKKEKAKAKEKKKPKEILVFQEMLSLFRQPPKVCYQFCSWLKKSLENL
jgi:hypothetical protein